jgi:hypothetical protein
MDIYIETERVCGCGCGCEEGDERERKREREIQSEYLLPFPKIVIHSSSFNASTFAFITHIGNGMNVYFSNIKIYFQI